MGRATPPGGPSAPVEQVGRRWSGCWRRGREPEVGENPPDDDGVLDGGHDAHPAATLGTGQHVHPERMPHQLRPRPLARRRRWGRLHAHGGGRVSTRHRRRSRQRFALVSVERHDGIAVRRATRLQSAVGRRCARWNGRSCRPARDRTVATDAGEGVPPVGDRPGAPPTARRQHTMVQNEVDARARRERRQPFEQRPITLRRPTFGASSTAGTPCTAGSWPCAGRRAGPVSPSHIVRSQGRRR